jgi:transposase
MRVAKPIELIEEDRRKLEQQSRGRSIAARVVMRSRIILLAAAGLKNKQIAEKLKVAPRMATLWRDRASNLLQESGFRDFLIYCILPCPIHSAFFCGMGGIPTKFRSTPFPKMTKGLLKDAPRPGRPPSITAEVTAALIEKTTQSIPVNATHWSMRTMAQEMGICKASVFRIWRAHGLNPHRVTSFKVSSDPNFAEKLEDVAGLYLNPPEHALVLSADENSQIQALDRTQPGLPMKKGRGRRQGNLYHLR